MGDDPRVERRAEELTEDEREAGVEDAEALARAVIEESDERSFEREPAEERRSEDTVDPA